LKIVHDFSGETPDGVVQYIQKSFDVINDESSNHVLMNGYMCLWNEELKDQYKDYERKSLLALWTPCEFFENPPKRLDQLTEAYSYFDDIFCVCPYSCDYFNSLFGTNRFKYIPYPYTNYSVADPIEINKGVDVCYFGGLHLGVHHDSVKAIGSLSHKFLTKNPNDRHLATHFDIPTEYKLKEVSRCKVSLNFNILQLNEKMVYEVTRSYPQKNEAFAWLPHKIAPQFKVRVHESASCGSLILCLKDPWNVIEDFYTPGTEFCYFSDPSELPELIKLIHDDWSYYSEIARRGYERSKSYTVEKLATFMKTLDPRLVTWKKGKKYLDV
jgi:hypothetical protein